MDWLTAIVDATADFACAFKPQIAHFSAIQAETELVEIIKYIKQHHPAVPIILDAKRGDIGSTAEQYAIEAFERYQADAVTANPYLGHDSLMPLTAYQNKGVIALCKTSNQGSGELQNLTLQSGEKLFEKVAKQAAQVWNNHHNMLLVVGATYPQELESIRQIVGDMPLLIPGVGSQGGDLAATLAAGLRSDGKGLIISSSRAIIYAGDCPDNFAAQAGQACQQLQQQINAYRQTNNP